MTELVNREQRTENWKLETGNWKLEMKSNDIVACMVGFAAGRGIDAKKRRPTMIRVESSWHTSFMAYTPDTETTIMEEGPVGPTSCTAAKTILIVDDEETILSITGAILERFGYRVLTARDGVEAVDLANEHAGKIHLVLLDLNMPVMGGAEAFSLLRKTHPALKVILWSGYNLSPSIRALLDAGASGFVRKPFRIEALTEEIRKVLG